MGLQIILSFDHELPLGGVKESWDKSLFEPTEKLFDLSEKVEVPIVLFTDVLSAKMFEKWDYTGYFMPYISQIKEAIRKNHDVQLHLHPHWLTSDYSDKKFIPSDDFSLDNFINEKGDLGVENLVKFGVGFLNETLKKVSKDYNCIAFRAGGYNLGSRANRSKILKALYENGIKFDSSISKGYIYISGISTVNYCGMPIQPNWFIDFSGDLKKSGNYGIYEIPIASIPKSVFEIPTKFKVKKYAHRAPENRGFLIHDRKPIGLFPKFKQMFSSRMLTFDNYTYSHEYLMKVLNFNINKHRSFKNQIFSVIGHPKSMGDYSFELMERFIDNVRKKYPEARFTTFSQIEKENLND